jgi:hypothetical protein
VSTHTALDCPKCGASNTVEDRAKRYLCASCRVDWMFKKCEECKASSIVATGDWACPRCSRLNGLLARWSTAAAWGAECGLVALRWSDVMSPNPLAGKLVIRDITLAAAGGTRIPSNSSCLIAFMDDCISIQSEAGHTDEIPYTEIQALEVTDTAATRRNSRVFGGGFGVAGAAEGMLAATVINSLVAWKRAKSLLRIATLSTEYVFVSTVYQSEALSMLLTPVQPRIRQARAVTVVPSAPPTPITSSSVADELRKLAELRGSGVLSDEEFDTLKARLISG